MRIPTIVLLVVFSGIAIQVIGQGTATVQPSIMVVPFKVSEENYLSKLESDRFYRAAVAKIDEFFLERGFRTVDFLQQAQSLAAERQLTTSAKSSFEQIIAESALADIIVYFDAEYHQVGDKYVDITLKAIDAQSAQVMSTAEATSNPGNFDDGSLYIKNAISKCAEKFLGTLNNEFTKITKEGRPMKLSIVFAQGSSMDFDEELSSGDLLSEIIDDFLYENSVNGYYRCPTTVATKIACNDVRIPVRDSERNNRNYRPADFYKKLRKFLRTNHSIYTKSSIVGSSLTVTICGRDKC